MYLCAIAIYSFLDDLLKAMRHHEDCRAEVSDAEILTVAISVMLSFGGNQTLSREFLGQSGWLSNCRAGKPAAIIKEQVDLTKWRIPR